MNIKVDVSIPMGAVVRHIVLHQLETDLLMALEVEAGAYAEDRHPPEHIFYRRLAVKLRALREWIQENEQGRRL